MSDSYLGATERELLGVPLARCLPADSDQLIGFRWFTGINQAGRWAPVLRTWSCAQVSAS